MPPFILPPMPTKPLWWPIIVIVFIGISLIITISALHNEADIEPEIEQVTVEHPNPSHAERMYMGEWKVIYSEYTDCYQYRVDDWKPGDCYATEQEAREFMNLLREMYKHRYMSQTQVWVDVKE